MKDLAGRLAVVTGGGSGMGRELVRQLVAEGCSVAFCDVSDRGMSETRRLCEQERLPQGLRLTTHLVDVADRHQAGVVVAGSDVRLWRSAAVGRARWVRGEDESLLDAPRKAIHSPKRRPNIDTW